MPPVERRMHHRNKPITRTDGWKVPRMWEGGVCFILGGGPSLNLINFDLIKDRRIIAVNNAYGAPDLSVDPKPNRNSANHKPRPYTPRPWVDVCWFGDGRWYPWHRTSLKRFGGLIATCEAKWKGKDRVMCLHRGKPAGIDHRPRYISWGKCSGNSAINFAYHTGVKRVVLLGFDMRRVEDSANWHDDHPAPKKDPYERFIKPHDVIAKDAEKHGLQIINCTPGSALDHYPIMALEDYLASE